MSDDIQARLAAAKAKKAEIEAKRNRVSAEEQLAKLERECAEQEALAELEDAKGKVGSHLAVVETEMGMIVVERPHVANFRKFQDAGKFTAEALEKLARPCVVYPDKAKFDQIITEYPGVLIATADAVVELAGARKREQTGK